MQYPKKSDEFYIARCFELATKAAGNVSPNPLVGAVIVKNGEIISEAYHKKFGEYHAERNAILKLGDYDFSNCEIFCNLEPCTHFGKTPPCCDFIIEKQFKRVVFSCFDPNPLVAGKSLESFRNAGITTGFKILENEGRHLNRFFFKHIQTGIPWVIAKWAQTSNGLISSGTEKREQITGLESLKDVHQNRAITDAILIGKNTALIDNPSLTVRYSEGRNPKRFVIDRDLSLPLDLKLLSDELRKITYIIHNSIDTYKQERLKLAGVNLIKLSTKNCDFDLNEILAKIGKLGINSIIVEGGAHLLANFFKSDLVDEIHQYTSPKIFKSGLSAPIIDESKFELYEQRYLGDDMLKKYLKL